MISLHVCTLVMSPVCISHARCSDIAEHGFVTYGCSVAEK